MQYPHRTFRQPLKKRPVFKTSRFVYHILMENKDHGQIFMSRIKYFYILLFFLFFFGILNPLDSRFSTKESHHVYY